MKKILFGLTLLASLSGYASNCVITSLKVHDLGNSVENDLEKIEGKLEEKNYFIDYEQENGIEITVGTNFRTGQSTYTDWLQNAKTQNSFGSAINELGEQLGHLVTLNSFK